MDDDLWMVLAVIQPFRLDAVSFALQDLPGFGGMTVSECGGYGRGKLDPTNDPGVDAGAREASNPGLVDFTAKVRVEVAVAGRATAERVVEAIARTAHTGNRGDGKVFAWPLGRAVRVRTFDDGAAAL